MNAKKNNRGRNQYPEWTQDQIDRLRQAYSVPVTQEIDLNATANLVGRSKSSIAKKASKMGLTSKIRGRAYSVEQARKLHRRKLYENSGIVHADIIQYVIAHHKEEGSPTMAKALGCSETCVDNVRKALGLPVFRGTKAWRRKQGNLLRQRFFTNETSSPYSRACSGRRKDLDDIFFRSRWEANYARYLNYLKENGYIKSWKFEPKIFYFKGIRKGSTSYTPDFEVFEKGSDEPIYHEVKGWMDPKSKTKLKRMKKYYPNVKIILIGAKSYRDIARKFSGVLANWESDR